MTRCKALRPSLAPTERECGHSAGQRPSPAHLSEHRTSAGSRAQGGKAAVPRRVRGRCARAVTARAQRRACQFVRARKPRAPVAAVAERPAGRKPASSSGATARPARSPGPARPRRPRRARRSAGAGAGRRRSGAPAGSWPNAPQAGEAAAAAGPGEAADRHRHAVDNGQARGSWLRARRPSLPQRLLNGPEVRRLTPRRWYGARSAGRERGGRSGGGSSANTAAVGVEAAKPPAIPIASPSLSANTGARRSSAPRRNKRRHRPQRRPRPQSQCGPAGRSAVPRSANRNGSAAAGSAVTCTARTSCAPGTMSADQVRRLRHRPVLQVEVAVAVQQQHRPAVPPGALRERRARVEMARHRAPPATVAEVEVRLQGEHHRPVPPALGLGEGLGDPGEVGAVAGRILRRRAGRHAPPSRRRAAGCCPNPAHGRWRTARPRAPSAHSRRRAGAPRPRPPAAPAASARPPRLRGSAKKRSRSRASRSSGSKRPARSCQQSVHSLSPGV